MDLNYIDLRLSVIARKIDFYSFLTPVNQGEEKEKFLDAFKRKEEYNPLFLYKEKDLDEKKEELLKMRSSLNGEDVLQGLFLKKIDFVLAQIDLLETDDDEFVASSIKLYGSPDDACLDAAWSVLMESKKEGYVFPDETVTPSEMAEVMQKELGKRGISWRCALSSKIIPKVTVSPKDRTMYVNDKINYTPQEISRLVVHEIEVHIARGANGSNQPYRLFAEGLAGYDETEEGLAIAAENIRGCLQVDTRQMKLYAGRAVGVDLALKSSFYKVFSELLEFFPMDIAYRITERAKRGIKDTSRPGGITNNFHYISGWQKVKSYIEHGGNLSILYVGKIGLGDVEPAGRLLARGILKKPEYLPAFIKEA